MRECHSMPLFFGELRKSRKEGKLSIIEAVVFYKLRFTWRSPTFP